MNILIGILIFLSGLSLSGILYMFGVVQLTPIPYNLWLLSSMLLFFILFKIRFKNKRIFKFFILRSWMKFNMWFKKIDKKITVGNKKLSNLEEKAIKLWKLCLKDKGCLLQCSISNHQRQIESGSIMMMLIPQAVDYSKMIIFDGTPDAKCNFYEVTIPQPHLEEICHLFDDVVLKRIESKEQKNKELIEDVFDTMIWKQGKIINSN